MLTGAEGLGLCCLKGGFQSRVATDEREENLGSQGYVEESVLFSQGKNNTA